ncbi:hypothetical protein BU24DRAFT_406353 [Aaosphaeria arxii CBS 175.79]|uniref:Uncharacterized protein n=1 Tax=Aaosphaeria arxii CBS 175.79 TaxID=1450172 RepID=A0A6A5Y2G2_9PLEO|nr:uncharacterized protein BU24DRAFT_406353 [Aaosphaeria arxii CBS 175.79]KAF2019722.1 hypothetical protein BU24DRAFT_406353 [Aaosphaeria arxii CBS 175.79]
MATSRLLALEERKKRPERKGKGGTGYGSGTKQGGGGGGGGGGVGVQFGIACFCIWGSMVTVVLLGCRIWEVTVLRKGGMITQTRLCTANYHRPRQMIERTPYLGTEYSSARSCLQSESELESGGGWERDCDRWAAEGHLIHNHTISYPRIS